MTTLATDTAGNGPLERPASLKDAAYRQIKGLLISGQLERDHLYSAQHFADRLGVSRTPVREALLQLTSEGFLVCRDVRGFKIKDFSTKEIRDVFETRQLIESYTIKRLVEDLVAADLQAMEQSLHTMKAAASRQDAHGFLESDKEFHMVPVRHTGNLHLRAIMDSIRNQMSIFGMTALAHPGRYQEVIREHEAIVAALRQRDKKKAVQAMSQHLATTESRILERVEETGK
ncbi:MAG: GntR family transcriptional regulator [Planctomycetia bacterium]|nr:GntR family transcriptional regulator [Planctomycetia bacterium]